jgi:hypothetical protein
MAPYNLTEKEYRLALKAALVIEAVPDALDAMTGIAVRWLDQEDRLQEAANVLAYVISHPDVDHATFDDADERFMDLESSICPRVIQDAREFILSKSLTTMANYIDSIAVAG